MPALSFTQENDDEWIKTAVGYAKQFGWRIVPLHPNPCASGEGTGQDPVVKLLGRSPLVDLPEGASSDPDVIRDWSGMPEAGIAVLTGTGSNLVAVEIGAAARRGLGEEDLDLFRDFLPETRCVNGPERDYYLFSLRDIEEMVDLPRKMRSKGVILHGQDSLIRVPGTANRSGVRAFRWDLHSPNELAPFPPALLSFFGIEMGLDALLSWSARPNGEEGRTSHKGASRISSRGHSSIGDGAASDPKDLTKGGAIAAGSNGEDRSGSRLSFRSGDELRASHSGKRAACSIPWLPKGALSLLCGRSKTAGKSTFAVNTAAHFVAGRSFLGYDLQPQTAVVLSDLPASQFSRLLSGIGIGKEGRNRLHVLHPKDVKQLCWKSVLSRVFDFARGQGAALIVLDSLDQFIEVKGGVDTTMDSEVAQILTTDVPDDCALLAVKALSIGSGELMSETIDRLGLLGRAADLIARIEAGPAEANPELRRLQFRSRLQGVPEHLLCEMSGGRYQPLEEELQGSDASFNEKERGLYENEDVIPASVKRQGDVESNGKGDASEESEAFSPDNPGPSIVHKKLSDESSEDF